MRLFRRLFVSIAIAALFLGAQPLSLTLGCVAAAATFCENGDCDEREAPEIGCVCIHYLTPQPSGSLAVFDPPPLLTAPAALREPLPAPPATIPARGDPPEPPPPRSTHRRS